MLYVFRRLGESVLALLALVVIVFFLSHATGDPTSLYLPINATAEARQEFSARSGYSDPLYVQFGRFVRDLSHGDFGNSLYQGRPAIDIALEAFPTTLELAAVTMSIAIAIALVLGSTAAIHPNGVFDRIVSVLTIVAATAPGFWVAIVAVLIFAVDLRWLPTSGIGGFSHWIMPVGVLVVATIGLLTQVVRSSMLAALTSDYVKTARVKGAGPARILFVHALRNALLPLITVAGIQASGLINGAIVVETIFGFPGIGNLMIRSVQNRDFAVTMCCIVVVASVIFILNVTIDLIYGRLDPRIKIS